MELTRNEAIQNAIDDLEWAYQFVQSKCKDDDVASEEESKLDDMRNSIEELYEIMEEGDEE